MRAKIKRQIACQHLHAVFMTAEILASGRMARCHDCGVWLEALPYTYEANPNTGHRIMAASRELGGWPY